VITTDAIRRARAIGAWERRYRTGTLPEADTTREPALTATPAATIDRVVEGWVASHWSIEVKS
jgi:hypothetical protein